MAGIKPLALLVLLALALPSQAQRLENWGATEYGSQEYYTDSGLTSRSVPVAYPGWAYHPNPANQSYLNAPSGFGRVVYYSRLKAGTMVLRRQIPLRRFPLS